MVMQYGRLVVCTYRWRDDINLVFTAIVAGAAAASVFVVLGVGYCYHISAVRSKQQEDVEYPAYGVTGPAKASSPAGDRKLAQSAQMYHYQHQKNQMISIARPGAGSGQEEESEGEGEGEEGDYTVYECPGLASVGRLSQSSLYLYLTLFVFRLMKWK